MSGGLRDIVLRGGRLVLPANLLSVRFSRSGGPGGQNVNKVETKVDLRLDVPQATAILGVAVAERLVEASRSRIDSDGWLQVVCDEHRSQARNLETAFDRLVGLIQAALQPPRQRRKTRPTRGSVMRRLDAKKRRSDVKRTRRRPGDDG